MPKVNGEVLQWARETAGLGLEESAKKIGFKDTKTKTAVEKLVELERSEKVEVSRSRLASMATAYHRPLIALHLNKPPKQGDYGEDFRALPGEDPAQSALVRALIRQIKASQSIVRDAILEEDDAAAVDFVHSIDMSKGYAAAAEKVRAHIGFEVGEYRSRKPGNDAFKYLRGKVEDAGVFVILKGNVSNHLSNIDLKFFRGLALADSVAPFIVINDLDQKGALSFTLLHELAHLFLGRSGVSNGSLQIEVEKFCNDIASEILLPSKDFEKLAIDNRDDMEEIERKVSDYATKARVSCTHVAYRLLRTGNISNASFEYLQETFLKHWKEGKAKIKAKNKDKKTGANYYVVARWRLGALVSRIEGLTRAGILSPSKAGIATNTRAINVYNLFEAA